VKGDAREHDGIAAPVEVKGQSTSCSGRKRSGAGLQFCCRVDLLLKRVTGMGYGKSSKAMSMSQCALPQLPTRRVQFLKVVMQARSINSFTYFLRAGIASLCPKRCYRD